MNAVSRSALGVGVLMRNKLNQCKVWRFGFLASWVLLAAANLAAQGIYGTLTGVVSDQSQAVVAKAKVILKDAQSGSLRESQTNNEGYFTFASVPVGNYELTVEAKGFTSAKMPGISLGGGEKRNVDIALTVGTTTETVEVAASADLLAPVDSGEKSSKLTTKELQNFVQTGSNAAEFIKIMPGFGISNGTSNKSNYGGETIGINGNGDAGSQSPLNGAYSYNGLPNNSLDITADGAHVSDPGCNCDTPVNPNSDMISEFQVKMSNFSAENQKGPAVITSVAKSWQGLSWIGVHVCPKLRHERKRRPVQRQRPKPSREQVLLSWLHDWRPRTVSGHQVQ